MTATDLKAQISRDAFATLIDPLMPPDHRREKNGKCRAGHNGGFVADLNARTWFDHRTGKGGGVLDAVIELGYARDRAEAADWLLTNDYLEADPERMARNREAAAKDEADAAEARARNAKHALRDWAKAKAVHRATLGGVYLEKTRALRPPWGPSLRFLARCYCGPLRGERPALIGGVSKLSAPHDVIAIQRIFLEPPGRKCSELEKPKLSLGPITGGGVILGDVRDALVIAEGIESALSASRALGLPAVAVLGASNLPKLEIPDTVRRVVIAPDRDEGGTGERHARALGVELARRGVSVALAWAPDGLNDWNDWTMREAAKITEAAYAR
ncbi:MAG: toprim domain-containing protein [Alphaproteobacteria bacterium]|nr:toprim domain-containing protein [Alphaproteobacteria bacterium]